jgi:iron complex outermembrane recepter protein
MIQKSQRLLAPLATWTLLTILHADESFAQQQQAEAAPTDRLEEITVTATKRAEPLQDVPEAVSALTGATLQEMGAASFTDYARSIPGLTFTDLGAGREVLSIRGINATVGAATVGYYIGETPIPQFFGSGTSPAVNPNLIDIDRIEVLRGPQGTLYGSGSIGGTIKLIPNAPDLSTFGGSVKTTGMLTQGANGASPGGEEDIVLNVPIIDNIFGVRMVFWDRDVGGFINRTFTNQGVAGIAVGPVQGTVGNLPDEHTWGFRTTALFKPNEQFDVTAQIYLQHQHFNGYSDITGGAANPGNGLVQNFISNVAEPQENDFVLYSLTVKYDFGRFNLVSSTGYSDQANDFTEEGTSSVQTLQAGPPVPNSAISNISTYNFTEETRLATSEKLFGFDGVLGVYYSRTHSWNAFNWSIAPLNENFFGAGLGYDENQTAEFGEFTYHLTDALSLTAGLRHYHIADSTDGITTGDQNNPSDPGQISPLFYAASSEGTVYKGNLSYQVTPKALLYLQFSEGFRPGFGNMPVGVECGIAPGGLAVQPDSIKNYEFGTKTQWLDDRMTVNAAIYQINWANIQQEVELPCGFGITSNYGDAKIKGVELEMSGQITHRLSAGASGSYISAKLQQGNPAIGYVAGDQIEDVPNWQFALYAKTTYPILQSDDGFARLDYQYTGSSFGNYNLLTNGERDPLSELDVTRLLNFKSGMHYRNWEFSVGANNLLNDIATQSIDPNANVTTFISGRPRYVVNRPRTFLIDILYNF